MRKANAIGYDAHKDYDVDIDAALLNMRIKIYGEDYSETGTTYYEGSIGIFLKERIPSPALVALLPGLRHTDKVSYRFSGGEYYIERVK